MTSKRYGMVFNLERCIGCEACTVACNNENNASTPWIKVHIKNAGTYPDNLLMEFTPLLCNHCSNPPCVECCPEEALIQRDDGIIDVKQEKCTYCLACVDACPYDVIIQNQKSEKIEKCSFCAHRIDQGEIPFCAVCCEGQAITFGDLNDPSSEISKILKKEFTFQLKTEERTNPNVYYIPPMQKRRL